MANRASRRSPSLVELVVALGLVGVVVVLAMPLHQTYGSKARVSEALIAASQAKYAVTEYMIVSGGDLPPQSATLHGTMNTDARQIDYDGEKITIEVEVSDDAEDKVVLCLEPLWSPRNIDWRCGSGGDTRYAPEHCRERAC